MKLEKKYRDKINAIEKLLNKHQKLIIKNDSLLSKHIEDFRAVVKELNADVKVTHAKLDEILNIEVNGTIGLRNVLRIVYEATKEQRASHNVMTAIKEWVNCHKALKLIIFSRIGLVLLTIIIINLLKWIGFDMFNIDISKIF